MLSTFKTNQHSLFLLCFYSKKVKSVRRGVIIVFYLHGFFEVLPWDELFLTVGNFAFVRLPLLDDDDNDVDFFKAESFDRLPDCFAVTNVLVLLDLLATFF